ncbi:MAG: C69 family dipeptidase [bacterium]|nr:C69 family dipeptidase [bacterium]
MSDRSGLVLGFAVFAIQGIWACTGMYAGKAVSAEGTILIGRTVDTAPWTACHRFVATPRISDQPGRVYAETPDGFTWPLPPTTYAFVSTPRHSSLGRGAMHSACANEKGFVVSGTVTAHAQAKLIALDPMVSTGAGENSLPGLLATCCATAREGLDLLARVIAEKGHHGGEIYMLADRDEAWYVEVYTGHQWAAVKMPDDQVACFGNQFMIRSFDPASPETRHSPDLIELARKAGTLVTGPDGLPDIFRSYSISLRDYSNYRTWFGHRTLAPETAGAYAEDAPQPLFFAPARKVTLRDFFELQRTRYEGTDHNPESNNLQKVRVIGTTKQATCHVIQVDPRLPAPLAGTVWATVASAEHGLFVPLNAAITSTPAAYAEDQKLPWQQWDPLLAGPCFRRLSALAEKDRVWYGAGVRDYWRTREDAFLEDYPNRLAAAARDWSQNPRRAAAALTDWTNGELSRALAQARAMTDELLWYITANNRIEGDGSGATAQPSAPFRPNAARRRTRVLFFFDTEDFTCDESNDAIRDIANILHEEGVRGQFAMVCELGNFIPAMKRQDVLDALKHHLLGSQTFYHSRHPNIVEYADIPDYAEAYRRTRAEEEPGFELLKKAFGVDKVWCSVFPGNANSYVGLYVHSELGSPFFGGGNASFTPGEREAAWFVNQFHLPYYKKLHLESFIPPRPMIDLPERLDELSTRDYVTLYMHPHMALSTQHWDGPNFNPRDPVAWGQWRPTPKRDKTDVKIYYDRLRQLVRALVRDPRFEVTDCQRLAASFRPRRPITRAEVPRIRASLQGRLAPIGRSWCVADAFQGAVKLLRGEASHLPGRVYGFLEPPKGVTAPVTVTAEELRAAARTLDISTFIPPEVAVGARTIGPADFLLAALEVLETNAATVTVAPRDQLGPIHALMPSLAGYSMKGGWPLYEDSFQDAYLTARLRLQLWTLRYED